MAPGNQSILIVEDEAVMVMYLEMRLSRAGFTVCESVATGEDAIASFIKNSPEIVLMDIRLGGSMDGIEAAREMNKLHKSKILFMSGYSDSKTIEKAEETQPLGYLVKPFEINELLMLIKNA